MAVELKHKFSGFDDAHIIINPEFNKSLKESLRQSKRRLMLFIDNDEDQNPVDGTSDHMRVMPRNKEASSKKFRRVVAYDTSNSNINEVSQSDRETSHQHAIDVSTLISPL